MAPSPYPYAGTSSPFVRAVIATATALATGLPLLFLFVRVVEFYGAADPRFGFWIATHVLPGWAAIAFAVGNIIGFFGSAGKHWLRNTMLKSLFWSGLFGLLSLVALLEGRSEMVKSFAARTGSQEVTIAHVVTHHLFDSDAARKIRFDPCIALGPQEEHGAHPAQPYYYEFCIPDSAGCRNTVLGIDSLTVIRGARDTTECHEGRILCILSTGHPHARTTLYRIAELTFVRRIRWARGPEG